MRLLSGDMKTHNQLVVQEMLRTSDIITHLKNARTEIEKANGACRICIVDGKPQKEFHKELTEQIIANKIIENKFTDRMVKLSKLLEGFDCNTMDAISYISRFDVSKKVVDIVKNTTHIGWLDLKTGVIHKLT